MTYVRFLWLLTLVVCRVLLFHRQSGFFGERLSYFVFWARKRDVLALA
jgi:hypothetical protein